jgi:hypothetical protein
MYCRPALGVFCLLDIKYFFKNFKCWFFLGCWLFLYSGMESLSYADSKWDYPFRWIYIYLSSEIFFKCWNPEINALLESVFSNVLEKWISLGMKCSLLWTQNT